MTQRHRSGPPSSGILGLAGLLLLAACGDGPAAAPRPATEPAAPPTNRIDVPPAVRRNLGITFAKVVRRAVTRTTRVPGRFELVPSAHRAYHVTLAGEIELAVRQYEQVRPDQVLFRIVAPAWRAMQQELAERQITIRKAHGRLAILEARRKAVDEHAARLKAQRAVWAERLAQIESLGAAGGGVATARTEARAALAAVETSEAEVHEEQADVAGQLATLRANLAGYREATPLLYADALGLALPAGPLPHDLALARAASLVGLDVAALRAAFETPGGPVPRWRALARIEVRAQEAGVVERLAVTNGAWADAGAEILRTVAPERLRFRAAGLQADLDRIRDGMPGVVLPPGGPGANGAPGLPGTVRLGLEADPLSRRIDLLLTPSTQARPVWARAGVSTELELVLAGTAGPVLAIPRGAVIRDGLERILFRRDPKDPDRVIRLVADLGPDDGHWVVVESGLKEGDEVVHAGIYELMLASGGAGRPQGGHFHADGTFHAGEDR